MNIGFTMLPNIRVLMLVHAASVVEVCQRHPLRSPRQPLLRYNGGCTQVTSQGDRFMTAYSKLIEKNVWSSRDIELTYVDNKIVSISISLSLEDYREKT